MLASRAQLPVSGANRDESGYLDKLEQECKAQMAQIRDLKLPWNPIGVRAQTNQAADMSANVSNSHHSSPQRIHHHHQEFMNQQQQRSGQDDGMFQDAPHEAEMEFPFLRHHEEAFAYDEFHHIGMELEDDDAESQRLPRVVSDMEEEELSQPEHDDQHEFWQDRNAVQRSPDASDISL